MEKASRLGQTRADELVLLWDPTELILLLMASPTELAGSDILFIEVSLSNMACAGLERWVQVGRSGTDWGKGRAEASPACSPFGPLPSPCDVTLPSC